MTHWKIKACVLMVFWVIGGCGPDIKVVKDSGGSSRTSPKPRTPNPSSPSFATVAAVLKENCERCHANQPWFTSETSLRRSGVESQVASGSMPPNGRISASDRSTILNFF
jgi:uncharacterized membrane protein